MYFNDVAENFDSFYSTNMLDVHVVAQCTNCSCVSCGPCSSCASCQRCYCPDQEDSEY